MSPKVVVKGVIWAAEAGVVIGVRVCAVEVEVGVGVRVGACVAEAEVGVGV